MVLLIVMQNYYTYLQKFIQFDIDVEPLNNCFSNQVFSECININKKIARQNLLEVNHNKTL